MRSKKFFQYDLIDIAGIIFSMLIIFMMVFTLVLFARNVYAGVTTDNPSMRVTPGPATLTSGEPRIDVTAFYTGDDVSSNNSITIEWGVDGGSYTGSFISGTHPASPYSYSIVSLDNSVIYQVRITITDPDNAPTTITKEFNGVKAYNPLLHNAVSTGSGTSKWGSGWGIAGGQYGEFTCSVCHERKSGNIKRIRNDWSAAGLPAVPANQHGDTVDFATNIDGSAEYALDDTTDHSSSNRICEACHTLTNHHRHDESAVPSSDHQSTKNCTDCHNHQNAFAPSGGCSSCHGGSQSGDTESNFWPDSGVEDSDGPGSADDSGEHAVHMTRLAQEVLGQTVAQLLNDSDSYNKQLQLCNYCHENPGSDGDHMNGDDAEVTRFLNMAGGAEAGIAGSYSAAADTCSNVDCHNGKDLQVANNWYAGSNPTDTTKCLLCHTVDGSNGEALIDPASGLHYHATPGGVIVHDDNFSSSGDCLTCHTSNPSSGHFNSVDNTPDQATFNFQSSAAIDIKLNDLADASDDTCAADCHSDGGAWHRVWSTDAFDTTSVNITQALPPRCRVCHGVFNEWAEGSSHAQTYEGINSIVGNSHNSQNPIDNPGATCEDCHNYPSDSARHENGSLTINDDTGSAVDPIEVPEGTYCAPCHAAPSVAADYPPESTSEVIPHSVFPREYVDNGSNYPIESCFSGAVGCHGDKAQRWWPSADWATDPANPARFTIGETNYGYPNRAGAHPQHNVTLGTLVAETRGGPGTTPTDEDFNATCRFCHPMEQNAYGSWVVPDGKHRDGVTDMYGGYKFDTANEKGEVLSGDPTTGSWTNYNNYPNATDGYLYQLDNPENPGALFPLDRDVAYRQYLYEYRADPDVNHGTCSQIACHSNTPFTPQWYGDEQPPGQVTGLVGYTHNQDVAVHDIYEQDAPGTVHLYWNAPGDNGDLDGTAYEYEVFYSQVAEINDADFNVDGNIVDANVSRAGGVPTVYRKGEAQEMLVDGLVPDTDYYFAVRTKDQPRYKDTDKDGIYETFVADGSRSSVTSTGSTKIKSHVDDVNPIFWGVNIAESHDTGGAVNLSWDAARDHTLPITYLVYWTDYALKTHLANGGTLPTLNNPVEYDGGIYSFGYSDNGLGNAPSPGGSDYTIYASTSTALTYQANGLESGVLYNFMVKAEDGAGNIDDNGVVSMSLPTTMPQEPTATILYLLDGTSTLTHQNDPTSPDWSVVDAGGTGDFTFTSSQLDNDASGATISRAYWVNGISLDLYAVNADKKLAQPFSVEFGYNGSNVLGTVNVSVGRRAQRLVRVGLSNLKGEVPADATLYVKVDNQSGGLLTLRWGNIDDKGQLLITAQPVNHQPSAPSIDALSRRAGGYVDITWDPSGDNESIAQAMHYDIYGSADNGVTWPYVIGLGLTDADANPGSGVTWDTVGDGLVGNYSNCKVKIEASDGYRFETVNADGSGGDAAGSTYWHSHVSSEGAVSVNNSTDDEAPAAVTISHEEPRPKQGAVYLHWIAVGNDGYNHGTRAAYYDIRFRKTVDGALNDASWDDAATIQAEGEPVPGFAGTAEEFELLNMTPDTNYYTAIKTCDESGNCSGMSNVYTITSGQFYCGICHSTPPDEPDTRGTHRQHGYTLEDCALCHGDGTGPDDGVGAPGANNVMQYDGRHYDGVINIGWSKDASGNHLLMAKINPTDTNNVSINQGAGVIYNDPDGAGGYNSGGVYNATTNTDSGRCMNFIGANANGCHGPFSPQWAADTVEPNPAAPACADCHGDKSAARDLDPYGRIWDCNVSGAPSELVKASPPQANHGGLTDTDRYVGAHEVHLNSSFRFAKGDSCRLCHRGTMELGLHADGNVDVLFDAVADKNDSNPATVDQTHGTVNFIGASCGSLSNAYCHDTGANWAEPGAKCNDCHGMSGLAYDTSGDTTQIGHVMGANGDVVECTYCHVAGHPQSPDGINSGDSDALLINNNAAVGINYRSGGIHLKRAYPWGTYTSLAEICWGCHDQNHDGVLRETDGDISEFESNTRPATGDSPYDFGTLNQSSWVGATWESGYPVQFAYKKGMIQSTHTTDPSGTSAVSWDSANGRYNETIDSIDRIRCSNCHDVHNLNLAPGDTMTGIPYLRGTWQTNPYEEDGAPYNKTGETVADYFEPQDGIDYAFGKVPRGGTGYDQLGGYYIDQNNVIPGSGLNSNPTEARYPTSGWTFESSAGLCKLCHTYNGTGMDQRSGENLWLGPNGHSNSALGGDLSRATNIFDTTHGRPAAVEVVFASSGPASTAHMNTMVPDMSFLKQGEDSTAGGGYRGTPSNTGNYNPPMTATASVKGGQVDVPYGFNGYDWGASVDTNSTDYMYHQFSCSKCHNPHASRLPKLMITNCLDIRHNTWDDDKSSLQTLWANDTGDANYNALYPVDGDMPAAYYASAQTCHRYDGRRSNTTLRGGWNKVTPWTHSNDTGNPQHPDVDGGEGQPSEDYNSGDRTSN